MTAPPRSSGSPRLLHGAVLLAVVLAVLSPVAPAHARDAHVAGAPARSTSGYLCTGYVPCASAGYPHHGYKQASSQMWWRMYAGHNCTNYVAYRLVDRGMSPERPWNSTGMAYNWGRAKRGITDNTPMVGSVAWWDAGDGVGSSGHVAYVEQVHSKRKITISEDSWGGDFHWRVVTKDGGRWPTGFIHFLDEEVELVRAPSVPGTPTVGEPVTADVGAWRNAASHDVQWLADGTAIPGATDATFVPGPEHVRSRLTVRVSATAKGYEPGSATSAESPRVERGELTLADEPSLAGTPRVDEVLTVVPGSSEPAAASTEIRWYADGERLSDEAGRTLELGQDLIRKEITATVVSRREGYRNLRASTTATPPVRAGLIRVSDPFGIAGRAQRDRTLTVRPGSYTPTDAEVSHVWLRDGIAIEGADGPTYVPGIEDVGRRVTAQVVLRRTGYRTETIRLAPDTVVTTAPDVTVRTVGRVRRAVVRVRVTAPGVEDPKGQATVRLGKSQEVTGRVVDGVLRVVFDDVRPGARRVRVRYLGTTVVRPARRSATVEIRRP
ncbi:CHAP domain-containing protein [Nocardioides coralli]|uniref:CHAP domain-containing protein n=1 Tax=Nocardioides coralli TaxID=2872154 RepID=UPI001CA45C1A|nr:CHAP domain-containing protein [Nocardioides coralli]QZY28298.1 CHAP domain-containing protein [Nocardioides coralli]